MSMTEGRPDAVWHCVICAFCGSEDEANQHVTDKPRHPLSPLRTGTGRIVTVAEMERWIDEAQHGARLQSVTR